MPAWKRSTPISQIETFTDSGIPVSYPDPLGSFLTWRRQLTSPNMPWWSDLKELTGDKDYWRFHKCYCPKFGNHSPLWQPTDRIRHC